MFKLFLIIIIIKSSTAVIADLFYMLKFKSPEIAIPIWTRILKYKWFHFHVNILVHMGMAVSLIIIWVSGDLNLNIWKDISLSNDSSSCTSAVVFSTVRVMHLRGHNNTAETDREYIHTRPIFKTVDVLLFHLICIVLWCGMYLVYSTYRTVISQESPSDQFDVYLLLWPCPKMAWQLLWSLPGMCWVRSYFRHIHVNLPDTAKGEPWISSSVNPFPVFLFSFFFFHVINFGVYFGNPFNFSLKITQLCFVWIYIYSHCPWHKQRLRVFKADQNDR